MSKPGWAAIVYGRSYHLDFRFITIPQDFSAQEIAWASPYILATTQQARNLANFPRWSLFKNDTHCVLGVTCMVRDLLGNLDRELAEEMTKDQRGRPLYVFVGYVTQLSPSDRQLVTLLDYQGQQLDSFLPLYQEIKRVWLAKEYETRQPRLSQYQLLDDTIDLALNNNHLQHLTELSLNTQAKYPQKTFLWSQSKAQNRQLWLASAQCEAVTSICLDIQGKHLINSPFLNQTVTQIERFTIKDRLVAIEAADNSPTRRDIATLTWKQKISHRAKADLDLTRQQAAKVTSVSQEIVSTLNPWREGDRSDEHYGSLRHSGSLNDTAEDPKSFGFKAKPKPSLSQQLDEEDAEFNSASQQQEWF